MSILVWHDHSNILFNISCMDVWVLYEVAVEVACVKLTFFLLKLFKTKMEKIFNLDIEKGQLHNLEIDHVIEITYKVCKELLK